MQEEAEYEAELERQVQEMEDESKNCGNKPSKTCNGHKAKLQPEGQGLPIPLQAN